MEEKSVTQHFVGLQKIHNAYNLPKVGVIKIHQKMLVNKDASIIKIVEEKMVVHNGYAGVKKIRDVILKPFYHSD